MIKDELPFVLLAEFAGGLAGMIVCAILDQDEWAGDLAQQVFRKDLVDFTSKVFLDALIQKKNSITLNTM